LVRRLNALLRWRRMLGAKESMRCREREEEGFPPPASAETALLRGGVMGVGGMVIVSGIGVGRGVVEVDVEGGGGMEGPVWRAESGGGRGRGVDVDVLGGEPGGGGGKVKGAVVAAAVEGCGAVVEEGAGR
jgi:hypothetical protein